MAQWVKHLMDKPGQGQLSLTKVKEEENRLYKLSSALGVEVHHLVFRREQHLTRFQ